MTALYDQLIQKGNFHTVEDFNQAYAQCPNKACQDAVVQAFGKERDRFFAYLNNEITDGKQRELLIKEFTPIMMSENLLLGGRFGQAASINWSGYHDGFLSRFPDERIKEEKIRQNMAKGMNPDQAEFAAMKEMLLPQMISAAITGASLGKQGNNKAAIQPNKSSGANWNTNRPVKPLNKVDQYYINKTDFSELKKIDIEHILKGHLNNQGNAVGYHHESSGTRAWVTRYTSPPNAQGVYKGKVALQGKDSNQWVPKRAESTFFPKSWSEARVKYEITEAFKKGEAKSRKLEPFIEKTPSGIPIKFVPPTQDGKIQQWRGWPLQQ